MATHTLSHSHVLVHTLTSGYPCTTIQPHTNTNTLKYTRMHAQCKWLSTHCHTALCMHIETHLAVHALQHSTVHAHTHTYGYPCTKRRPHLNTNTCRHSSMHTQNNWLHIHCRSAMCYYLLTHLDIHALQGNSMQTQTHSNTHTCMHNAKFALCIVDRG